MELSFAGKIMELLLLGVDQPQKNGISSTHINPNFFRDLDGFLDRQNDRTRFLQLGNEDLSTKTMGIAGTSSLR